MFNLFLDIVGGLKAMTSKFLHKRGFNEDYGDVRNLLDTFGRCEAPYRQLATSYQQEKYFDNSGFLLGQSKYQLQWVFFHTTIQPLVMLNNVQSIQYFPIHSTTEALEMHS